ncbi:hypothetical protein LAD12857_37890 [Lacrimispora amygdalina]|uniref:Glycosyltransferase family 9 protein n=1 Tax=Lacrimispora amygdalina TaxID=253257 RepID=A0ABQ5MAL5_9FIRM
MKDMLKRNISILINELLFTVLKIKAKLDKQVNSNNIFIIRFAHIGDFCIWLNSAKAYRELYPEKKIIFLTYSYKNITELAEATGYFDKVISFETEGFRRIRSLKWALHFSGDKIINANPSRSLLSDLFVLAVNVNCRIAQQSDITEMSLRALRRSDRIYDRVIPCDLNEMELIKNADFIRGLGLIDFRAGMFEIPEIPCKTEVPDEKYAIIFPDADTEIKMWDYKKFAEVIKNIIDIYQYKCLLLGGGKFKHVGTNINDIVNDANCINLMGQTSLAQCIQLVRNAQIVVSNDTGGAHIAAGVRTPCVVLAVGWNRGRFFPYKLEQINAEDVIPVDLIANVKCLGCGIENINRYNPECGIQGVPRCIAENTVEDVLDKIKEVMEQKNGKSVKQD